MNKLAIFGIVDIKPLPGAGLAVLLDVVLGGPGPQKDQIFTASILDNGS